MLSQAARIFASMRAMTENRTPWRRHAAGRLSGFDGDPRHHGTMPEANSLDYSRYPDVAAAGDLRKALQDTFDSVGIPMTAQHMEAPGWVLTHAVVHAADRQVHVHMTSGGRAFALDLGVPGFQMAHGRTADLREVAAAIATFLNGATLRQLGAAWPFVTFSPFAAAFERGEPDAIAYRWQQLLDPTTARTRQLPDLRDFLVAAIGEPRLHALYPFTSHYDLGFRRSVLHTQSQALAWVRPLGEGRYLIAGQDRRQLHTTGPIPKTIWDTDPIPGALGPAPAQESIALVLQVIDRDLQA